MNAATSFEILLTKLSNLRVGVFVFAVDCIPDIIAFVVEVLLAGRLRHRFARNSFNYSKRFKNTLF